MIVHFPTLRACSLPLFPRASNSGCKAVPLPSQRCAEHRSHQDICQISPGYRFRLLRLKSSQAGGKCADRKNSLSTSLSATSFAACLATSCFIDRHAFAASCNLNAEVAPRLSCAPLTSLLHKNRSFFAPPSIRRPRVPRRRMLRSDIYDSFVPFSGHFVPQASVPRSFQKAHHHDVSLGCCSLGE